MTLLVPTLVAPKGTVPAEPQTAARTTTGALLRIQDSGMNEDSLTQLYQRHAPAIYAHCRRLLGSQAQARDATHEAFARTLAQAPGRLGQDEVLRYLYRVSTNVCLNLLREQRVHQRAHPALAARANAPSPEGRHAARAFALALLDRCDEMGASIAVLHFVDGLSQVEIASTLGISRRTVFNRLRKLASLAQELLGPGEGPVPPPGEGDEP